MTITHLLSNTVIVLRMSEVSTDKMASSTVTSVGVNVFSQPLLDEKNGLAEGVYGKTYAFYTDGSISIYPGDRLRDSNGKYYTVKSGAVTARQFGNISYVKIIAEQTD